VCGNGRGFIVGSIEGRCSLQKASSSIREYCFKCSRVDEKHGEAIAKPINGIAFNKKHNTAVTFGGDGILKTFNIDTKKVLFTSNTFPLPI